MTDTKQEHHDVLYYAASQAAEELFMDTSVSTAETRRDMEALKDEIQALIDSLDL